MRSDYFPTFAISLIEMKPVIKMMLNCWQFTQLMSG